MTRRIKIYVNNTCNLDQKIMAFFQSYNFELMEATENHLIFQQKASLLEAWKANPLKWGSKVSILLSDNSIVAVFLVDSTAQLNTMEEKRVWRLFIENFKYYLVNGAVENARLSDAIAENKRSRRHYFGWAISGALLGALLSLLYTKLSSNKLPLHLFLIPAMTILFLKWRITLTKNKYSI